MTGQIRAENARKLNLIHRSSHHQYRVNLLTHDKKVAEGPQRRMIFACLLLLLHLEPKQTRTTHQAPQPLQTLVSDLPKKVACLRCLELLRRDRLLGSVPILWRWETSWKSVLRQISTGTCLAASVGRASNMHLLRTLVRLREGDVHLLEDGQHQSHISYNSIRGSTQCNNKYVEPVCHCTFTSSKSSNSHNTLHNHLAGRS